MTDERRVLRPVLLTEGEAALAYMAVLAVNIPGARAKDAAALLAKVEAAMVEAESGDSGDSGDSDGDVVQLNRALNG